MIDVCRIPRFQFYGTNSVDVKLLDMASMFRTIHMFVRNFLRYKNVS
jgi:hypothetical protein